MRLEVKEEDRSIESKIDRGEIAEKRVNVVGDGDP